MEHAHAKNVEEILASFNVDESVGLTDDQIKKAIEKYGPNGEYSRSK